MALVQLMAWPCAQVRTCTCLSVKHFIHAAQDDKDVAVRWNCNEGARWRIVACRRKSVNCMPLCSVRYLSRKSGQVRAWKRKCTCGHHERHRDIEFSRGESSTKKTSVT